MKKISKFSVIASLSLAIIASYTTNSFAQNSEIPKLGIGFSDPKGSINHKRLVMLTDELRNRGIVDIKMVDVPAKRSLLMSNKGQTDGEITRIRALSTNPSYPNLRIVDGPWGIASLKAVTSKKSGLKFKNWESVGDNVFCYQRGILFIENKIKEHNLKKVSSLTNQMQALQLVDKGRCDVTTFWYEFYNAEQIAFMKEKNLEASNNLAQMEIFMYLHKSHEALIPAIEEALKAMKADGTQKRIFDESEK